jgi:methylmalonyl-CoA/ethylmalonyl-CoA epimerase
VTIQQELQALRVHANRLCKLASEMQDAPLLARFAERIEALVDEAAWEGGVDPHEEVQPRPKLDHVGIAVRDLGEAANLFGELLGGRLVAGGTNDAQNIRTLHFAFAHGGKVELLQPLGTGPLERYLAKRGEGLHHITVLVDDLAETLRRLEAARYEVVGEQMYASGWREAYVSPAVANGCLVQVVQAGPWYGHERADVTVEAVLDDRWEWVGQVPRRRGSTS